jgi:hypothetical protein
MSVLSLAGGAVSMFRGAALWPGPCALADPHDAGLAACGGDEVAAFTVDRRGRLAVGGLFGAGSPGGADQELIGRFV